MGNFGNKCKNFWFPTQVNIEFLRAHLNDSYLYYLLQKSDGRGEEREQWGGRFEFVLSLIGCSVGLGNVWKFPGLILESIYFLYFDHFFYLISEVLPIKMVAERFSFHILSFILFVVCPYIFLKCLMVNF